MKKLLIGLGVFIAILYFVAFVIKPWGSKSKKPSESPKIDLAPAPEEKIIDYKVLRMWTIGTSGIGKEVLVSPTNTKDEVMALAKHLRKVNLQYGTILIDIFDSEEAWANRLNDTYPEAKYWKHYLVRIEIPASDGIEIRWVAEGRIEPKAKR